MGARVNNRTAETRYDLLNLAQYCFLDGPGGGAFAFLFGPTPEHLTDLLVPTPGNLPFFYYKNATARRGGRAGGEHGHCYPASSGSRRTRGRGRPLIRREPLLAG